MKSEEVFNRIEEIINGSVNKTDDPNNTDEDNKQNGQNKSEFKKIIYLLLQLVLNVIKSPFKIVAKYLRDEIFIAIKNDARIYMMILGIMGVLFVFFSVIWLFISVAVGVYFYDNGHSILNSIVYSIIIQLVSFLLVSLIAFIASKKLKSLKVLKKLKKYD